MKFLHLCPYSGLQLNIQDTNLNYNFIRPTYILKDDTKWQSGSYHMESGWALKIAGRSGEPTLYLTTATGRPSD
jgi:hypothetical protein